MVTKMVIADRKMTARQAANEFAKTAFDVPRKVWRWNGQFFTLVNGIQQYEVKPHRDGWEILAVPMK